MSTAPSRNFRNLDVLGIMSTTAGGIGITLALITLALRGQLIWAERYATHVNNGHGIGLPRVLLEEGAGRSAGD